MFKVWKTKKLQSEPLDKESKNKKVRTPCGLQVSWDVEEENSLLTVS
jgi:hypothetical protein